MQTNKIYEDIIAPLTNRDAYSIPILTADFESIQVDVVSSLLTLDYSGIVGGPFNVGEIVTNNGGDTGIMVLDNDLGVMYIRPLTGTWVGSTSVTGADTGAVATITATATPSFTVNLIKSNQELPPNPSLPVSGDNFYSYVLNTNEADGVNYTTPAFPYTQTIATPATSLNVSTTGARWMFVFLDFGTGVVEKINATLFAKKA